MRLVSSLSLLSLAGLGLANPVNARDDAAVPRADALSALAGAGNVGGVGLGSLGLREEKQGVSPATPINARDNAAVPRADALSALAGAGNVGGLGLGSLGLRDEKKQGVRRREADDNDGSGSGSGVLLRAPEPAALDTREESTEAQGKNKPKSKPDGKGKGEEPKAKGKGKPKGKGKSEGKGKAKCNDARHTPCLHSDDVDVLVDAYVRILSNWNDTDAKYLADSFRDTSDSINILAGISLGSATFPTKQAFIDHQHTQVRLNLPNILTSPSISSSSNTNITYTPARQPPAESHAQVTLLVR